MATTPGTLTPTRLVRLVAATTAAVLAIALATPAADAAPRLATAVTTPVAVTAPTAVNANAKATISVTTAAGDDDTAHLWSRSTVTGEWVDLNKDFSLDNGSGSVQITVTTSRTYRVQTGAGETSSSFGISMRDSSSRAVTAKFTSASFASSELAVITGKAYKGSSAYKGAKVTLERAASGSSTWSKVSSATASASTGNFTFRLNPIASYRYRVVITSTYARSGPVVISATTSDRTLESRSAALAPLIGSATGSAQAVAASDLPSGVSSARYQTFSSGVLVEVTKGSGITTWVVFSKIGSTYGSLSRWEGKLGLPMRDAKCGLLEGGCVQRFTGGAVYQNDNKSSAYTAYGTVAETEIIAAAKSQVGYIEPSKHKSKFNTWVGSNYAWCSVFMGWAATASGNSSMVPTRDNYSQFLATLKSSGVLHYSGTPPVGAVVLFDWGSGTPSHSAIVRGHTPGYLYTVEGNTSNGKGGSARGVYERSRALTYVWAWFWPHDYAAL